MRSCESKVLEMMWEVQAEENRPEVRAIARKSRKMTKQIWTLDEIEVDVSGFFTTHHVLRTDAGILGELTFPAFSQCATYKTSNGRELLMQKTSWLGSTHELVEGEVVRGSGDRPGLFRRDIVLHLDGQRYSLEPEGVFSQGWRLFDATGQQLLEIQPRGIFRQGAYLTITGAVDADLVAFAYYLVHMRQQEDAAAAAAASGAAAS